MGDILQTPQFQMRRLKKQLADERNNRDELELELAENRKLLTERGSCLAHSKLYVSGQHLGFSPRETLGLSEEWPLCRLYGPLCWPSACQADLLEAGSVLASNPPFPLIGCCLLALPPPLGSVLTLFSPPAGQMLR